MQGKVISLLWLLQELDCFRRCLMINGGMLSPLMVTGHHSSSGMLPKSVELHQCQYPSVKAIQDLLQEAGPLGSSAATRWVVTT